MSDKKKPELSADIADLAEKLEPKFLAADGKITPDADVYESTLPEGLTPEIVRKVAHHNTSFYPAAVAAATKKADPLFKKDPELQDIEVKVPLAGRGNHLQFTIERSAVVTNPRDRSDERTVYGNVAALKLVTAAARPSGSSMKTVRELAADRARAAYGEDDKK